MAEKIETVGNVLTKGQKFDCWSDNATLLTFGNETSCDYLLPLESLDSTQFLIYNNCGNIMLVDQSDELPTRMKLQEGQAYALSEGDLVNIGLEQDLYIQACSDNKSVQGDIEGFVDFRWNPLKKVGSEEGS